MTVREYIYSNRFNYKYDFEIRNIENSELIFLGQVRDVLHSEHLQNCKVEKVDSFDNLIIYINRDEARKSITIKTKISKGNTYVATVPCETEEKAKEITDTYTEAFRESMKIIGADPDTVSSSYEWVK